MDIDFFTKEEIKESINRIEELLNTRIFHPSSIGNPFIKSAFIEILICLRDLMSKTEEYAEGIDFDDDIVKTDKIKDITDTIVYVRGALCHISSCSHYVENGNIKATYNISYGKGSLLRVGESTQVSDYKDDVCFFFGDQRIYLNRHIIRAFDEAKSKLLPLIDKV